MVEFKEEEEKVALLLWGRAFIPEFPINSRLSHQPKLRHDVFKNGTLDFYM